MPVNQPAQTDDVADASWKLDATVTINNLEQRFTALLEEIQNATDLNDLKTRTRDL